MQCPYCEKANLELCPEIALWDVEHLICPYCDSTYPKEMLTDDGLYDTIKSTCGGFIDYKKLNAERNATND
jgi:hypothetical protein